MVDQLAQKLYRAGLYHEHSGGMCLCKQFMYRDRASGLRHRKRGIGKHRFPCCDEETVVEPARVRRLLVLKPLPLPALGETPGGPSAAGEGASAVTPIAARPKEHRVSLSDI